MGRAKNDDVLRQRTCFFEDDCRRVSFPDQKEGLKPMHGLVRYQTGKSSPGRELCHFELLFAHALGDENVKKSKMRVVDLSERTRKACKQ